MSITTCPKCGATLTEADLLSGECPNCLIVFKKYEKVQAARLKKASGSASQPEGRVKQESGWAHAHEILRKIGVYEFIIKFVGLIALIVTIYMVTYVYFVTFEPGKNSSPRIDKESAVNHGVASVKDNYGACLTKGLLNQLFDAHHNGDNMARTWLMSNGCVLTRSEWRISVVDRGILKSKIRVYAGAGAMELWVDSGSLDD